MQQAHIHSLVWHCFVIEAKIETLYQSGSISMSLPQIFVALNTDKS